MLMPKLSSAHVPRKTSWLGIMLLLVFTLTNGKEFDEVVIANNKKDAIEVALKNNPEAEILNSDWTFKL